MAYFKPPFGTPLVQGHPLAPTYGAWLLNSGAAREWDSVNKNCSAPTQSGLLRKFSPWGIAIDCPTSGGVYPIANLRTPSGSEDNNQCIVARVYPRNVSSGFHAIYADASTGFFVASGKLQLFSQTASTGGLTVNTWQTVAVQRREGSNTDYYINGRLDSTIASGTIPIPVSGTVGIGNDGANEFFDGLIDYVYLYSRTLSPAEHLALHLHPYQMYLPAEDIDAVGFGGGGAVVAGEVIQRMGRGVLRGVLRGAR